MAKHITDEDLDLLEELGVDLTPPVNQNLSPREERIIAGFEEIERFVEEQGRLPQHGEDRDIFERIYAVRLDRLRELEECRTLLEPLDSQGLLRGLLRGNTVSLEPQAETELSDEALLESLGIELDSDSDITQLNHVRSHQEIKAAEEIAQRTLCTDFKPFKLMFKQVQQDLKSGARKTLKYQDNAAVNEGDLFILDGQKVLVAEMGEFFTSDYGKLDSRLRVIYDNGTESDLLMRSLQRALNKDKTSRRITKPETDFGPLFSTAASDIQTSQDDIQTGYIYVLRSQSDHPFIVEHRSLIHKIGVTSGDVKKRIAQAKKEPTYLFAEVEIVATFRLANINPQKLEALLHKFFDNARLELSIPDRFGIPVQPREWFLVPLRAIEQVVEKITDGTLDQFHYDRETASIMMQVPSDVSRSV